MVCGPPRAACHCLKETIMAMDIMAEFEAEDHPLDFVIPGFLSGTVGALVAPGATGKSYLALEMAMGIACTVAGGDLLGINPGNTGRTVYVAGEDPRPVIGKRLRAIRGHLNPQSRESIAENLDLEPCMGSGLDLMRDDHLDRMIRYCDGARLVILDTLSRVHTLDENSNGEMARLFMRLEQIAAQTGAAVLFLHHTSKAALFDGKTDSQHASRGASLLTDNARFAASLVKMSETQASEYRIDEARRDFFIRYAVTKNNYGAPVEDRWYERHEGGVLRPAVMEKTGQNRGNASDKGAHKASRDGGDWDDW